jgi:hypothetical protein
MNARMFSVASFLLVSNENTVFAMNDYSFNTSMQYYPEYDIDIGVPITDMEITDDSLFIRYFEKGMAIVNPHENNSRFFDTGNAYFKVVPVGGGIVDSSANYDGYLTYEMPENQTVEIPPVNALVLIDTTAVGINEHIVTGNRFQIKNIFPNPFSSITNMEIEVKTQGIYQVVVFDMFGKPIKTVFPYNFLTKGLHSFTWNGKNDNGNHVQSGLYVIEVKNRDYSIRKKVLLLR